MTISATEYGGSSEGIRAHYDVGNEFWPLVLGSTLAYSCAMWTRPEESLDEAQQTKLNWHISASGALEASRVLDVGCGWGSILRPLSQTASAPEMVGLTLSDAQAKWLSADPLPRCEVRVENWAVHRPTAPYDSIISIGAFEHFAHPGLTSQGKIEVYRDFFQRCLEWLNPGGRMSLQTIAFGNMRREDASAFMNDVIFPESDLPFLSEVVAAVDGLFEITAVRNDRLDYARTMDAWSAGLRKHRAVAETHIGAERAQQMAQFFKLGSMGFRMGKLHLLRFALRPLTSDWSKSGRRWWGPPTWPV